MSIVEWDNDHWLEPSSDTGVDTIVFNDPDDPDGYYLLEAPQCSAVAQIRDTKDNVPQGDGSILHDRFYTGYEIALRVQLWQNTEQIACDEIKRQMHDRLMRALRSLQRASGRYFHHPSGAAERMFDSLRLLSPAVVETQENTLAVVSFTLDTPFPYSIDATEITTSFASGATHVLTNNGSAPMFPVIKVDGPASTFTVANTTTGQEISYDDALPGAPELLSGHYVEIDTFRNTAFLDGSGANMMAGIVLPDSDFWSLVPDVNSITFTGAGGSILWQAAWA